MVGLAAEDHNLALELGIQRLLNSYEEGIEVNKHNPAGDVTSRPGYYDGLLGAGPDTVGAALAEGRVGHGYLIGGFLLKSIRAILSGIGVFSS